MLPRLASLEFTLSFEGPTNQISITIFMATASVLWRGHQKQEKPEYDGE